MGVGLHLGSQRKGLKNSKKIPLDYGLCLLNVKIEPSQNLNQSTSLERSYKELLNACFSFEIRHS